MIGRHQHSDEKHTLVAVLLIVLGVLWLLWLWRLHAAYFNLVSTADDTTTRCHQVAPMLRYTLLVFAVFLSISTLCLISKTIVDDTVPAPLWWSRITMATALLVIFLTQIHYISLIQRNKSTTQSNCSQQRHATLGLLTVFAAVQVGIGVYLTIV